MKTALIWIAFLSLIAARADDRFLLARFELKDVGGERPVGSAAGPAQIVTLYRSALGAAPFAEFVDVETSLGERTSSRRLSNSAAGRLLDIFESTSLPDVDFQKHFEDLAKSAPEARRGIAWLPDGGGARRELIEIRTKDRIARFEIWSPEVCFYSHPSDRIAQLVFRILDGCSSAIGAETVFVSSSIEPNHSPEPTSGAVH